jgi:hypothetical protein
MPLYRAVLYWTHNADQNAKSKFSYVNTPTLWNRLTMYNVVVNSQFKDPPASDRGHYGVVRINER